MSGLAIVEAIYKTSEANMMANRRNVEKQTEEVVDSQQTSTDNLGKNLGRNPILGEG